MEAGKAKMVHLEFQDLLPIMARKLGRDGLINELCKGFQILMDGDKGVITLESLKKNSVLLGLQDFSEAELKNMLMEGDMDGDGALDQIEFCILMFRLSPDLLDVAQQLLHKAPQKHK
ncbi:calcium-binding protein PBP1-like [Nicotiana tomentosiformis]|uniref:calcium-binding protein PBP1-like n=1 Tax=Nicotiana tomentosiformis TaxID=4098 RepID=UPI00051CA52C|nr:calcium-binding protein PBP1-like [Nicotiana tomentosiformis]